jgi:hypothetical protein
MDPEIIKFFTGQVYALFNYMTPLDHVVADQAISYMYTLTRCQETVNRSLRKRLPASLLNSCMLAEIRTKILTFFVSHMFRTMAAWHLLWKV